MVVEIWSDVMCPFCYIGKRKFESALADFKNAENIEIIWKSFQLAPDMETSPDKSINEFLAAHKGISLEEAKAMNGHVADRANEVGLNFNFDQTIPANSFKAHRFGHFAKQKGVQNAAEEALFKAYFTEGKNIDDTDTLVQIGQALGLDPEETKSVLESAQFEQEVTYDIYEARQIGVRGVPFFVFDRKLAVSGAQESSAFAEVLEKTYTEWSANNPPKMEIIDGPSCEAGKDCG
ncbi:MAG: DsbA family oxidoreductase [Pedobacter sp.]|nr:MAG: DsbA family oxidoreductase [Pedobacter sp.]